MMIFKLITTRIDVAISCDKCNGGGRIVSYREWSRRTRFSLEEDCSEVVMLNLRPKQWIQIRQGKNSWERTSNMWKWLSWGGEQTGVEKGDNAKWREAEDRPCGPSIRSFCLERSRIVTRALLEGGHIGFGWLRHGDLLITSSERL